MADELIYESVPDESLVVGDIVKLWCGEKTITRITPYDGPLKEFVFALAYYKPGGKDSGFSLFRDGVTDRLQKSQK